MPNFRKYQVSFLMMFRFLKLNKIQNGESLTHSKIVFFINFDLSIFMFDFPVTQ